MHDMPKIESNYSAPHFNPLPVVLTRGEGVYVWDQNGKRYLDLSSAVSVVNYGHCHPRLTEALMQQAQKLTVTSRLFHNDQLAPFLQKICEMTGQDKAVPMNSGTEAVETAIKAARKWGYIHKNIPDNQAEIIVCEGNFHGRTISMIGLSTEPKYRNQFGPFTPGFKIIPYNNPDALRNAITPNTVAFLVEPIQGEAGVIIPSPGFLKQCETICRENQVLLLCDEVQAGLGRTGTMLACEHDNVKPDGVMLGKALGGGLVPISVFLGRSELLDVLTQGTHGSTLGGNPLAAAVATAALNILLEEDLMQKSFINGSYFLNKLRAIQNPFIKEIRGKGLFIAMEINTDRISTREIALKFLEHGILSVDSRGRAIRLMPALTISQDQIDDAVECIQKSLCELVTSVATE